MKNNPLKLIVCYILTLSLSVPLHSIPTNSEDENSPKNRSILLGPNQNTSEDDTTCPLTPYHSEENSTLQPIETKSDDSSNNSFIAEINIPMPPISSEENDPESKENKGHKKRPSPPSITSANDLGQSKGVTFSLTNSQLRLNPVKKVVKYNIGSNDPNKSLGSITYTFSKSSSSFNQSDLPPSKNSSAINTNQNNNLNSSSSSSSSSSSTTIPNQKEEQEEIEEVTVNLMEDIPGWEDDYYRFVIPIFRVTKGWADLLSNVCGWSATILTTIATFGDIDSDSKKGLGTTAVILGVVGGISGGYASYAGRAEQQARKNLEEVIKDHFTNFELNKKEPKMEDPSDEKDDK